MRLLVAGMVAVVLALPDPALAQALKPADLVGTWVIPQDGKQWADSLRGKILLDMLTLNADGSYTKGMNRYSGDSLVPTWQQREGQEGPGSSHWELTGDSLELGMEGYNPSTYIVQLKDRRLIMWNKMMWDAGRHYEACADRIYERFDPAKRLTLPPPQITVKPADLVGTWAGRIDTPDWGTVNDTLIIGPDHTLRSAHVGPADDAHSKGVWALLPGNILTGPMGNINEFKVLLHDGDLVRCHYNYAILKRLAP
jgi:hypothetical protein